MAQPKTRTYTGIFYTGEGAPVLIPLIQHMKAVLLPGIISPIHSADGEETKPHVHFMVDYPNPVRLETALKDYGAIAANGYMQPVRSRKQMMRYFLHLDDEDKEQGLDAADVITVCGAVFDPTAELTAEDVLRIMIELQYYCDEQQINEYSDFIKLVLATEKYDWYKVATGHPIHFNAYFRSLRHKAQPQ